MSSMKRKAAGFWKLESTRAVLQQYISKEIDEAQALEALSAEGDDVRWYARVERRTLGLDKGYFGPIA